MQTVSVFGFNFRWNESLTVNVSDGATEFYCYTLAEGTRKEFVNSIPEQLPYINEEYYQEHPVT